MNELISVIISTYKRSNELDRAIQSVLKQDYTNYEIIVVDDNGKGTECQREVENILNKYKTYPNIRYICNEKNLGGSLSRNKGIELAKGNYIAFLDDDDEYYPQKLEKQINLFKKSNSEKLAMVYCYTDSYDEKNKLVYKYRYDFVGNCLVDAMKDCIAATSQWLCRKECLVDIGGFTDVPSKQDSTVILKLLIKGYEVDRVPEVLVRYNEHNNNRISSGGIKNIEGELLLRNFCRSIYYKIKSIDIIEIEKAFSYRLCKLYVRNGMKKELKLEEKTLKCTSKFDWIKIKLYPYLKYKQIKNTNG